LPQGIAGRFNATELRKADWQALADELEMSGASTLRRVEELTERVSAACDEVVLQVEALAGDPARVLEKIVHSIRKQRPRMQAQCRRLREPD
jgi:serine/threonine-protein kinase HipA